jgi:4-amino-4-deoxychorismate lyase
MLKQLINGEENYKLSTPNNSFIFHGFSVFTTFLSFEHKPLFLKEHLNRLKNQAEEIGLNYPGDTAFLSDLKILVSLGKLLRIRLTVGPKIRIAEAVSHVLPSPDCYKNGVKIVFTPIQTHPQLAHLKTGNYLPYLMAKKKAEKENAFEGLLIDQNQHIVDGSRSSPMLYKDDTLTVLLGGLTGITRAMVLKKATALGLQVKYEYIKASQMQGQLLLAGSGIGLVCQGKPADKNVSRLIELFSLRHL